MSEVKIIQQLRAGLREQSRDNQKVLREAARRSAPSTTTTLLNAAFAADGIPMRGLALPVSDADTMTVADLAEDGVTLSEPAMQTRDGLRLEPLHEASRATPETDGSDSEVPTRRTVSTGEQPGVRVPCGRCAYNGRNSDGSVCKFCAGRGFTVREVPSEMREAAAAAVAHAEQVIEASPVLVARGDFVDQALAANEWVKAEQSDEAPTHADGTVNLGPGVPTRAPAEEKSEAATAPKSGADDSARGDLIDLSGPGVPRPFKRRSVAEILADDEREAREEREAAA